MAELTARGPVLVHFFDFAQLNSVRALPYVIAWDARYRSAGLTTLGVHSPRFPFTSGRATLGPALGLLGVSHPVADDSRFDIWHDYGCKGWPSLFLWNQGGALGWFHFGEGEYAATEAAIVEGLAAAGSGFTAPAPLAPIRATDASGAAGRPSERGGLSRGSGRPAVAAARRRRAAGAGLRGRRGSRLDQRHRGVESLRRRAGGTRDQGCGARPRRPRRPSAPRTPHAAARRGRRDRDLLGQLLGRDPVASGREVPTCRARPSRSRSAAGPRPRDRPAASCARARTARPASVRAGAGSDGNPSRG